MATRSNYGQTWWGEQWLRALTSIDYDNRLPRGRTYANKGLVKQLTMRHGTIHAKVQGSRPRPYEVNISVPPMDRVQADALLDALSTQPVVISRMLNRELDPLVLEKASALGIVVFPSQWSDLDMHCSCPDYAVPCKHLAAVIYLVSREIDGDPFLVFSLKGIELTKELQSRNISIAREAEAALPQLKSLLLPSRPDAARAERKAPAPPQAAPASYEALDYSAIPALGEALVSVLPAQPSFFPHNDFRQLYDKALKRIARSARQTLESAPAKSGPEAAGIHAADRPRILIDANGRPQPHGLPNLYGWPALMLALERLMEGELPDLQPETAALYHARMLSLHLAAQGALLPQMFDDSQGGTCLRWIPAMLDRTVQGLMARLAALIQPGLLVYRDDAGEAPLDGEAQALMLCSLFLHDFVYRWGGARAEKPQGNKLIDLFFGSARVHFDGPGEGAMEVSVRAWLSRFHLRQQQHAPVLLLEEAGAGFALALAVENRDKPLGRPVPLAKVLTDRKWQAERYGVLQTAALLAEFFPPLNGYIAAGAAAPLILQSADLPAFLFDALPVIRLMGIRALLPKALDRVLRPRLSMKIAGTGAASAGMLNADALFRFDWTVAIGEAQLTPAEFEALVAHAHGIVQFRGEYVYLAPEEIDRLRHRLEKPQAIDGAALLRIALAEEYAGTPIALDAQARAIIAGLTGVGATPRPASLRAALRPYQERGYAWLYHNARAGFGCIIADDMGLGKTVQVIAAILKLKEDGALEHARALVVMPTSLLTNWNKEIARFAPALTVGVYHGAARALPEALPDVMLTTYGMVRTDLAKFRKRDWRLLIVDEAQNIKNPGAAQTRAVKSIPAQTFIAISGTPVENNLAEYWSIMDFANRGLFGHLAGFNKEFTIPIQNHHDQAVVQRFQRVSAPFLLRRLKADRSIIDDLPDKIEQDQYCELSKDQAVLYESVVREALRVISGESDTFKRQGLVLQMIMALKQICNHPAQYLKTEDADAALSGKAERFLDLLEPIFASHEKVLVFTQFREAGELLGRWIDARFGRLPQFLHGGVPRAKRDDMVERFQNDRTERAFLLSLKAGGTGLNLTAASHVIHFDLWWNPAVEAQATDRAYRIGQKRNVQVHRLITRATFEERINDMIRAKRDLADLTVNAGEKWIGNLSNDELKDVFSLGARTAS